MTAPVAGRLTSSSRPMDGSDRFGEMELDANLTWLWLWLAAIEARQRRDGRGLSSGNRPIDRSIDPADEMGGMVKRKGEREGGEGDRQGKGRTQEKTGGKRVQASNSSLSFPSSLTHSLSPVTINKAFPPNRPSPK